MKKINLSADSPRLLLSIASYYTIINDNYSFFVKGSLEPKPDICFRTFFTFVSLRSCPTALVNKLHLHFLAAVHRFAAIIGGKKLSLSSVPVSNPSKTLFVTCFNFYFFLCGSRSSSRCLIFE